MCFIILSLHDVAVAQQHLGVDFEDHRPHGRDAATGSCGIWFWWRF